MVRLVSAVTKTGKICLQEQEDRYRNKSIRTDSLTSVVVIACTLFTCYTTPSPSLMRSRIKCRNQRKTVWITVTYQSEGCRLQLDHSVQLRLAQFFFGESVQVVPASMRTSAFI